VSGLAEAEPGESAARGAASACRAARQVTAGYARRMAPGSCLIISVACFDDEALGKRLAMEYTVASFVNHSRADIASFLADLDLVGPGLADAATWRPSMLEPAPHRRDGHVLAAVARRAPGRPGDVGARRPAQLPPG